MRFLIHLGLIDTTCEIPVNYQYPLSAAIYKIISKGDANYAAFLHGKGYGKGFKFFSFSQIEGQYKIEGDRFRILSRGVSLQVSFHLPEAAEGFVKGLFLDEKIEIADKKSRGVFRIVRVEVLPDPLVQHGDRDMVTMVLRPVSPLVAAVPNTRGKDDYLEPGEPAYVENIIYNWRQKIATIFGSETGGEALLLAEVLFYNSPPRSRLVTIKEGTGAQTRVRGWMNFKMKVTAEKRFLELLLNGGAGVNNAIGFGCVWIA